MQKIKYIVSGITQGRLEAILNQLKTDIVKEHGVLVIGIDSAPEVIEISEDGTTQRIDFGKLVHKLINQPQK